MEKKRARFTKSLSGGSSTCRILADQNRMESETDSRCNGEDIEQEDVKAEFKHGILKLFVPKKEAKKAVEENKYIAIEG